MHAEENITRELLAAELDRICESFAFRHSHRQQRFLRYLIDCKLAGRLTALREIAIGIDFFRRPANSYDPKVDAVVRVEAGRLRQRLDRYYHGEGAAAPIEISLDKGSYIPVLRVRAAAAVASGTQPSVAVLALAPATSAPSDVQRAAALTDEIVQTLSRLPQVRVFGPESSTAADVATAPDLARDRFRVAWIVRGGWSVDRRTLLIEIADTAAGKLPFSQRIDVAGIDSLALHQRVRSEVLHRFAAVMGIQSGDETLAHHSRWMSPTHDLAAFDLYQRASYLLKQRNQALLARAIEQLETAVRTDPDFSAAWAELAGAYMRRRQLVFDPLQRDPKSAQRAAQRAIDSDPECGPAYAILAGLAYAAEFDWSKADRLFAQALAATPRNTNVRCSFATFLMYSARFEESLREYDVVQALDPIDPATRCHKGALYFFWRRYERAETLLLQAIELTPYDLYARLLLADTYAQSGRPEESLEASRKLVEIAPDYANSHIYLARALRLLRREEEAADTMARARARFGAAITEYEEAMFHVAGGDAERTLACLERHALRKANGAHCVVVDPTFSILHHDSRWHSMLERAGLPDLQKRVTH